MYICICNAIRDTELRSAARCLRGNAEAVYCSLGRPPQCRRCIPDAEELLDQERARAAA